MIASHVKVEPGYCSGSLSSIAGLFNITAMAGAVWKSGLTLCCIQTYEECGGGLTVSGLEGCDLHTFI